MNGRFLNVGLLVCCSIGLLVWLLYVTPGTSPTAGQLAGDDFEEGADVERSGQLDEVSAPAPELNQETLSGAQSIGLESVSAPTGFPDRSDSLIDQFGQLAIESMWSYDDLAATILYWGRACERSVGGLSSQAYSTGDAAGFDLAEFCQNYDGWNQEEGSDFFSASEHEALTDSHDYAAWRDGMAKLDADEKLRSAAVQLRQALDAINEMQVLNIIGYLAFTGALQELGSNERLNYPFVAIEHASTLLICQRIGGCGANHPLTVRQCMITLDRACNDPENIHHAIEQLSTGLEIDYINDLLGRIERLLLLAS